MTNAESRLEDALKQFSKISFQEGLSAFNRREDILLGEIFREADDRDKLAIRAAPIQILGDAPNREVELAVMLSDGVDEWKRYLYLREDGTIEVE